MITYDPFWRTIKEKRITTYVLIHKFNIAPATIQRLKHNKNITTNTISELCYVLDCGVSDILEFVPNKKVL